MILENPFETAEIISSLSARWKLNPSYMHSFGLTKNFFVIIQQPLAISVPKVVKSMFQNEPLINALQWWDKQVGIY